MSCWWHVNSAALSQDTPLSPNSHTIRFIKQTVTFFKRGKQQVRLPAKGYQQCSVTPCSVTPCRCSVTPCRRAFVGSPPDHLSSQSTKKKPANPTDDKPVKRSRGRPKKHAIKTEQSPASQERAAIYIQQHGRESAYDKCSCVDKDRTVLLCDGCDDEFALCCVGQSNTN